MGREVFFKFWKVFSIYVDPTTFANTMNVFVGSKEHVHIPLSGKHCSLQAFVRHVVEHGGLRQGAEKQGLGFSIDLKLCCLEIGLDGNKVYAINILFLHMHTLH